MAKILELDQKYQILLWIVISLVILLVVGAIVASNFLQYRDTEVVGVIINEGDLAIDYNDGNAISFNDNNGHKYLVTLTNTSDNLIYYSIYFSDVSNSEVSAEIFNEDGESINKISNLEDRLVNLAVIQGGETIRYEIELKSSGKINFTGNLVVVNDSLTNQTFSDLILLNNIVTSSKTKVGSEIAVDDEGLIEAYDGIGLSHYFRGNVTNNYVLVGDLYFRIVRINGDDTVRLVLDDVLENEVVYNQQVLEDVSQEALLSNATVINTLNDWYNNNLGIYDSYFVAGSFCTETDFSFLLNGISYSKTYKRLFDDNSPEFVCNGTSVTSKVGLLSADEVIMAGALPNVANDSYYLYNENLKGSYVTTSSYFINEANELAMMNVLSNGALGEGVLVTSNTYLRPVVNVAVSAKVKGSGTKDDPYVIVA